MKPELFHGDFFRLWKQAGIGKIDLVLTDPPYNILSDLQLWDNSLDLLKLETILDQLLKPSGQCLVFCDLSLLVNLMGSFNNRLKFKHYHIWKKPGGMPVTLNRPISNAEFILVFKKPGIKEVELTWNPESMGESGHPYIKRNYTQEIPTRRMKKSAVNQNETGKRYPKTIIEAPSKPNMFKWERTDHPTQKPELLLRKLILGYSNPGDLILDPFAGSGSTLVSAFKEGRNSIGFEIEETYYQETKQRIELATKQMDIFTKTIEKPVITFEMGSQIEI